MSTQDKVFSLRRDITAKVQEVHGTKYQPFYSKALENKYEKILLSINSYFDLLGKIVKVFPEQSKMPKELQIEVLQAKLELRRNFAQLHQFKVPVLQTLADFGEKMQLHGILSAEDYLEDRRKRGESLQTIDLISEEDTLNRRYGTNVESNQTNNGSGDYSRSEDFDFLNGSVNSYDPEIGLLYDIRRMSENSYEMRNRARLIDIVQNEELLPNQEQIVQEQIREVIDLQEDQVIQDPKLQEESKSQKDIPQLQEESKSEGSQGLIGSEGSKGSNSRTVVTQATTAIKGEQNIMNDIDSQLLVDLKKLGINYDLSTNKFSSLDKISFLQLYNVLEPSIKQQLDKDSSLTNIEWTNEENALFQTLFVKQLHKLLNLKSSQLQKNQLIERYQQQLIQNYKTKLPK